mmetsp:Transcript_54595/g.160562  ORF Transcript_54595/g.160562 Transcript_54595/m.160562 type:complete len:319 (-) Transcript_54595:514-1470(-)
MFARSSVHRVRSEPRPSISCEAALRRLVMRSASSLSCLSVALFSCSSTVSFSSASASSFSSLVIFFRLSSASSFCACSSATIFRFGSTPFATSLYLTMAITHCSSPKPALDLLAIASPSNVAGSRARRPRICRTCFSLMSSLAYSWSAFRKLMSESIAFAPAQPAFTSSLPSGCRMQTHMQTIMTASGGFWKVLISVMEALSRFSRALAAASSAGIASPSASSASAFSFSITTESTAIFSAAAFASPWRFSTLTVFSLIVSMSAATLVAFSSTMIFFAASSMDISPTCVAACTSLSRPPPRRVDMDSSCLRHDSRNFM